MTVATVQETFNKGASQSGSHHGHPILSLVVPNSYTAKAQ